MPTPTQIAANRILEGKLDEFVAERRAAGRSWRLIARDLFEATEIDVTPETVRSWSTTSAVAS